MNQRESSAVSMTTLVRRKAKHEQDAREAPPVNAGGVVTVGNGLNGIRTLKIEADGDFARGQVKPKIRLMGRWLERAGFKAGNRVQVKCVAPGEIQLHAWSDLEASETSQVSWKQIECLF